MQQRESFTVFYVAAFVVVALASAGVYWFWNGKQSRLVEEAKARTMQLEAGPTVTIAESARGQGARRINLTGEARAHKATTLYSKVGGYLSRITVDVGDRVRAGQLIAQVQAPELESEYGAAQAELQNRQRIAKRTRDLAEKGFFSQQALDNADTDVLSALGRVNTLRSHLDYRNLYAPFSGVVTARFVDPGALVTNAANNQSSSQPVVTVSDPTRLKVTVYVEQVDAPEVKAGTQVEITDAANPARRIQASVSRVAGELDARTRTLLTEVDFDNRNGTFIPGAFVNVSLIVPQTSFVEVPASALVVRDRKNYVAVIGQDSRIKLTPVEIAGTDGAVLRVAGGIDAGTKVALNLPNTVADGARVNAVVPSSIVPKPPLATAQGSSAAAAAGTPAPK